jgi:hypothetical protein
MHLNKLSTAALMRLTILVSLDLMLGRVIEYEMMLHPLFFLIITTLNLGLYAVMVYTGTLNRTLIAMMITGLAGVLAIIAAGGAGVSGYFPYGGPFGRVGEWMHEQIDASAILPAMGLRPPPLQFWWQHGVRIAYLTIDAMGLIAIVAAGVLARASQARSERRAVPTPPPPS